MTDSEELILWEAALQALLQGGQSVTVLGRTIARVDADVCVKRIDELRTRVSRAARGGIRTQRMVGRD